MFGEISNFLERGKGESGGLVFFSPFIKKGNIGLWIFFMKEDHLNLLRARNESSSAT